MKKNDFDINWYLRMYCQNVQHQQDQVEAHQLHHQAHR